MKYLIEDENFLTKEEKEHIDNVFSKIPFYYQKYIGTYRRDAPVLIHNLVARVDAPEFKNKIDRNLSNHTAFFLSILLRFTKQYNLEFNKILRGVINITSKIQYDKTIVHVDHEKDTPHSIFMMYFGEDVHGNLNVYEEDRKTLIKSITPKNYKIVCFGDNVPHQFEYPKHGMRRSLVFTFN